MHQVLYIAQLPNEEGDMHIIEHLVHHDMPCDPNRVSSAILIPFLNRKYFHLLVVSVAFNKEDLAALKLKTFSQISQLLRNHRHLRQ